MPSPRIQQALLDSYARTGGINHLDGANLPAQDTVASLAQSAMHILFPGYFTNTGLKRAEVEGWLATALIKFERSLGGEIEKCLRFGGSSDPAREAARCTEALLEQLPEVRDLVQTDVAAAFAGDPAARSLEEIILSYPCVLAISLQRIAKVLNSLGVPLLPRMLTEYGHERTGIDIHPGATLGSHFFIDHGTGVVIGETARVGSHVKLYQGVTLGAKSFEVAANGEVIRGAKRHPDIGDHVTIYAHATILGGDTTIGANSIIGANVWLRDSVPVNSIVYYKAASLVIRPRREKEPRLLDEVPDWTI